MFSNHFLSFRRIPNVIEWFNKQIKSVLFLGKKWVNFRPFRYLKKEHPKTYHAYIVAQNGCFYVKIHAKITRYSPLWRPRVFASCQRDCLKIKIWTQLAWQKCDFFSNTCFLAGNRPIWSSLGLKWWERFNLCDYAIKTPEKCHRWYRSVVFFF